MNDSPVRSHMLRSWSAALAAGALIATGLALPSAASASIGTTPRVLINEVYAGGGNSGAPLNRDFIELYNASDSATDLTGWSVQYASASGTSWQVTPLTGTIDPGEHLLVGEAASANGAPIEVDVEGAIAMGATAGKVALANTAAPLLGCAQLCSDTETVVDFVGYGPTANDFAGDVGPALGASNTTSVSRDATHTNTASNADDFAASAPSPTRGQQPDPEPDPEEPLTIAEIQGTGAASEYVGRTVSTTGVVTAHYPTGGFSGYVIQTPGTGGALDAFHTASDAIFVFSSATVSQVALGDTLDVTGVVSEFNGLTELTVASGAATVVADAAPPAPVTLAWPASDPQRETLESMLFAPQGTYTVSNTFSTNQYGEVGLAQGDTPLRQPTDAARPGTPEAVAVAADNAARAVTLDDGTSINFLSAANTALTPAYVSLAEPPIVGASVTFTAPVIIDWRNDAWKLNPVSALTADGSGLDGVQFENTRTPAPADVGGDVSVASFNVLNYFTTVGTDGATCTAFADRTGDGVTVRGGCDQRGAWDAADLARQQDKIVAAITALDADVVGLMEIENSAALGEQPDEATATLVAALNAAAGSEAWAYVPSSCELPSPTEQDVITNAIIYQPAAVVRVGESRALGTQSADDQAFGNAREPLAQVFEPAVGGDAFLFVVNHFKSKGSAGPWPGDLDAGDGQGSSNESRERQASALRDWVEEIRGTTDAVVLAGDFNSYGREDPLQVLYDAGYADAEAALGIDTSSYSFGGQAGSLDHILLNPAALEAATGGDIWNINSGESIALEYSRYNYHGSLFYAPDPFRSSDHDPVKVGLDIADEPVATTTALTARPAVHINRLLRATLTASVSAEAGEPIAGAMEFRDGAMLVASVPVVNAQATLRLDNAQRRGLHTFTARFVPTDASDLTSSTSRRVPVLVLF